MKKFTFIFLAVFASLSLISCSSDDDNPGSNDGNLLGKWNLSQAGFIVNGTENLMDYEHECSEKKDYIEFKSNGTLTVATHFSDCVEMTDIATWTRTGNTLTVNYEGEVEEAEILILNTTTLKIKTQEEMGFEGIEVYTRP